MTASSSTGPSSTGPSSTGPSSTGPSSEERPLALVTGGNGFLGQHLCQTLIERGWRVRSLHRRHTPALERLGVEQALGDVCELETLKEAARGASALYHLAGRVSREEGAQGEMYTLHLKGTRNALQVIESQGLERALYMSTSGVVGVSDSPTLATEQGPFAWSLIRRWPYYESKAFAEQEVWRAVERGLPVQVARPSLLVGPGDPTGAAHGDLLKVISGAVRATLPGGLNLVDVRDVAAFLPTLINEGERGVGYLLGGENMTVRAFVSQVAALADAPHASAPDLAIPRALFKRAERPLAWLSKQPLLGGLSAQTVEMGGRFWYLDSSRAEALGFTPRAAYETLSDALRDLKSRGLY